jgi:hypothetical protein
LYESVCGSVQTDYKAVVFVDAGQWLEAQNQFCRSSKSIRRNRPETSAFDVYAVHQAKPYGQYLTLSAAADTISLGISSPNS